MSQIHVLIVDDHTVVRKGIQMIVNTEPGIKIVGEAKNGRQAIDQVEQLRPDVVLMDLVMPEMDGIEATTQIKRRYPHIKVIVLTTFDDQKRIQLAIEVGADGYLLKDADGELLLQAILSAQKEEMPLHPRIARFLVKGETVNNFPKGAERLTKREKEVLQLVARGLSNKEIAQILSLSEGTVKAHVSRILGKLNVSSRTEAAVLAAQMGLTSGKQINR